MKYLSITQPDINNGLGFRVTLWVSGCKLRCKGCHNPESWCFDAGKDFTDETLIKLLNILNKPYITGLTLSGGNPTDSDPKELVKIMKAVKDEFDGEKDIWLFSGNYLEDLQEREDLKDVLDLVDVLVDGPFILGQRDITLAFRGSKNQRIWEKDSLGNFVISNKFRE